VSELEALLSEADQREAAYREGLESAQQQLLKYEESGVVAQQSAEGDSELQWRVSELEALLSEADQREAAYLNSWRQSKDVGVFKAGHNALPDSLADSISRNEPLQRKEAGLESILASVRSGTDSEGLGGMDGALDSSEPQLRLLALSAEVEAHMNHKYHVFFSLCLYLH
jgi:hypothetical protein